MFGMYVIISLIGFVLGSLGAMMPVDIPLMMKLPLLLFGIVLFFMGLLMINIRLNKMGLMSLFEPGNPDKIIWFYIRKDGTIKITPSIRRTETMLFSPDLKAHIQDVKAYILGDHHIRFVSEISGKCLDTNYAVYANISKSKYDMHSLKDFLSKDSTIAQEFRGYSEETPPALPQSAILPQPAIKHKIPIPNYPSTEPPVNSVAYTNIKSTEDKPRISFRRNHERR